MKLFNITLGKRKVRDEYNNTGRNNYVSRWARPPSLNTAEWLDMFSKSPRLAVVDRIASDIANISGRLLKINDDGTETELTSHPFLDFMASPNPLYEMTSSAIWRLHEIYLLLVGEGFFLIERDENGKPVELWNVPPHWVKMTPYLGSPTYQILSPGGLSMDVPVDDMFVMKQLNPLDPFMRGLGVAESIADEVEIDEYAAKFQKRFFYNDATPPIVFSMPDATSEQRDEFLARWNQKFRGVDNSHRAAALSGNVSIHELGNTGNKNLAFVDSRVAMRDAVLEHFGVPREIMGITENSNRATADSAQYIYAKNVLTPRIKSREEAINKQLLPLFGDNLIWKFDAIVPYDEDFNKAKALDAYNAGIITKNEARHLLDFDDIDGGDVYKASTEDLFLSRTDDPAEVSQSRLQGNESMEVERGEKKAMRINLSSMLQKETQLASENEKAFEMAITKYFADQYSEVCKKIGVTTKSDEMSIFAELQRYVRSDGTFDPVLWETLPEAEQQLLVEGIASGLLDWSKEAQRLTEVFNPLWKKTYEDGAALSEEIYDLIDISRPEFTSAARINGGRRVVGIQQTTRKNIADIIANGVANGISQNELRKSIQAEMDSTKSRAKLIARQETMTALATGQFDMMKNAGARNKTWHHRPQNNPRDGSHGQPNHVVMDGETVLIDDTFSNGLRYPKDPNCTRPEELINCRCYLTYGGF